MIYNGNIAPRVFTSEYNSCNNTDHVLVNFRIGQANIDVWCRLMMFACLLGQYCRLASV